MLNDRANVEAIDLEYPRTLGIGDDQQVITIRERLEPDIIQTWRVDSGERLIPYDLTTDEDNGPLSAYPNALGIVPYVIVRHEHDGTAWGRNAFARARTSIDRLNALLSHIGVQIHRHVRAKWFIAASGQAPEDIDMGDLSVAYVDTRGTTGSTTIQPLVAPLDLAGAIAQARMQQELVEDMLPELKATAGNFLSGQSGDTVAELRKPAEDRLALARTNYEDGFERACKIAVSYAILLDIVDLGTGTGTREAADAAYRQGREDFRLNDRPLLGAQSSKEQDATTTQPGQAQPNAAQAVDTTPQTQGQPQRTPRQADDTTAQRAARLLDQIGG